MSVSIEGIFPAQLGIYKGNLSQAQLDYQSSLASNFKPDPNSSTVKKSYHGENVLEDPHWMELKAFIINSSNHFLINTFGITNKLFISNSWINSSHASASQAFHTHANSLISGTYYICFDPSVHPSIIFRHPRTLCSFSSYEDIPIIPTRFNSPLYKPSYMQGDLLLWPSYLEHGFFASSSPSQSNLPRVSLSFNINITGTLLHSYSLTLS
jgi:uncharacterized protein (TIGR02466 family)